MLSDHLGWYLLFSNNVFASRAKLLYESRSFNGANLPLIAKPAKRAPPPSPASKGVRVLKPVEPTKPQHKSSRVISDDEDEDSAAVDEMPRQPLSPVKRKKIIVDDEEESIETNLVTSQKASETGIRSLSQDEAQADVSTKSTAPPEDILEEQAVTSALLEDQMPLKEELTVVKPKPKAVSKKVKRQGDLMTEEVQPQPKKKAKATKASKVEPIVFIHTEDAKPLTKAKKPLAKPKKVKVLPPVKDLTPILDPIAAGLAEDEEDIYFLRLAIEASKTNSIPLVREIAPEADVPADLDEDLSGDEVQDEKRKANKELAELQAHKPGCARLTGYYKVPQSDKSAYLPQRNRAASEAEKETATAAPVLVTSRSTRVNQRRLVQGMEQHKKAIASDTDVFQFNQLRTRKKQLKFSRSPIHDWGLYAMEMIPQGEMVIEYVGEVIRAQVADIREKWYEKIGIGSSYLFRVDDDAVVDATKKGNLG